MKFLNKKILLVLVAFFWVFILEVQTLSTPVFQTVSGNDGIDTILDTELVNIRVSIKSSKKGYLENLTAENFEIYDDETLQKIEFLNFDKSSNQYDIGFYPQISETEEKHRVNLKVKLSVKEKEEFGKIVVSRQKWILSKAKN